MRNNIIHFSDFSNKAKAIEVNQASKGSGITYERLNHSNILVTVNCKCYHEFREVRFWKEEDGRCGYTLLGNHKLVEDLTFSRGYRYFTYDALLKIAKKVMGEYRDWADGVRRDPKACASSSCFAQFMFRVK